jgi:hypothetical protein
VFSVIYSITHRQGTSPFPSRPDYKNQLHYPREPEPLPPIKLLKATIMNPLIRVFQRPFGARAKAFIVRSMRQSESDWHNLRPVTAYVSTPDQGDEGCGRNETCSHPQRGQCAVSGGPCPTPLHPGIDPRDCQRYMRRFYHGTVINAYICVCLC